MSGKRAPTSPELPDELPAFGGPCVESGEVYTELHFSSCEFHDERVQGISFDRVSFDRARVRNTRLVRLHLTDVRLAGCDLANSSCTGSSVRRAELDDCRLTGFGFSESTVDDVLFVDCKVGLAVFHHTRFSNCRFERCDLRGADFEGSDLRRVAFRDCDLREARMVDARLGGTDFRGSRVEGMLVGPGGLGGAVIDPSQAVDFAVLAGLVLRSREDEE